MAKGNMILGYLRGAIGDIVFWRAKGQQMARARNRAPANPRTELQIDVRARWAMLSKFVSIMEPRFLRGAFETKRVNESDYNVFMRNNYNRAQMLSKTAMQNSAYPAPGGSWIMSQGSLPVVQQYEEIDDVQLYFPFFQLCTSNSAIAVPSASEQTIAWLSNVLLSVAPAEWRVGDIITFVVVSYDLSQDDGNPVAVPLGTDYKSQFIYKQIVINSTDATLLSDALGGYFHAKVYRNGTMFGLSYGSNDADAPAEWSALSRAATVIHSRMTSQGIKVSSSVLVPNGNYALNNSFMFTSDAYKSAVYADWQAAETAILQGASFAPSGLLSIQFIITYGENRVVCTPDTPVELPAMVTAASAQGRVVCSWQYSDGSPFYVEAGSEIEMLGYIAGEGDVIARYSQPTQGPTTMKDSSFAAHGYYKFNAHLKVNGVTYNFVAEYSEE